MRDKRREKQSSYFSLSQYSSLYLWEWIFLPHIRTHTQGHTHTAHRYCSVPPPSQADRCRSRRGTGHVPRSVDGMLSGRTRRQSSPPHTDTGPLSKHHGCHMAPGTALSDREKKKVRGKDIMSECWGKHWGFVLRVRKRSGKFQDIGSCWKANQNTHKD